MKNRKTMILLVVLAVLVIVAGGLLIYKIITKEKIEQVSSNEENIESDDTLVINSKKIKTFNGTDRPIAVMIDNHSGAWPQANLNKAYLVYEIVVEGGETRLMAVFKGQNLDKIGPVRSSRHYFLDYALENDAIYVHHGWSPQAQSDISSLGVNNINGIQESGSDFWRVKDKSSPHNLFTSTESILKIAQRKNYATTSKQKSVLNYVADEVELDKKYKRVADSTSETSKVTKQSSMTAANITIPHSNLQTVKYEYVENSKTYKRYARNKLQTDYITGEPVTTKNIIITMCENYTLDDSENKGRQGLKNIGTFKGYSGQIFSSLEYSCLPLFKENPYCLERKSSAFSNVYTLVSLFLSSNTYIFEFSSGKIYLTPRLLLYPSKMPSVILIALGYCFFIESLILYAK